MPDHISTYFRLEWSYYYLGRKNEDKNAIDYFIEIDPHNPHPYVRLSKYYSENREYQACVDRVDPVLDEILNRETKKEKEDLSFVYLNMGTCYRRNGDLEKAIGAQMKSLSLKESPEAHFNLGFYLSKQGKIEGAIEEYERAIEMRPDYEKAKKNLAELQNN